MPQARCLQESGLVCRVQRVNGGGKGPARGPPQFELGGVRGVLTHLASRELAAEICAARRIAGATSSVVLAEMEMKHFAQRTHEMTRKSVQSTASHRQGCPGRCAQDQAGSRFAPEPGHAPCVRDRARLHVRPHAPALHT
jgi:hypothetical protein